MESTKNRYLILIAIMFLTSALVNFLSYDTYHKAETGIQAIKNIPLEFGRWHGKDVPLENLVYEILETKSIIQRTYHTADGQDVLLSIVHYPETKVDFHVPEACLGGQGIQIQKTANFIYIVNDGNKIRLDLNQLIWKRDAEDKLVFYFYKAGNFLGRSYIKLRFNLAITKFTNTEKSGSLIRLSTPIEAGDIEKASATLIDYLNELYPFLIRYL